jgi:hypothetical protein
MKYATTSVITMFRQILEHVLFIIFLLDKFLVAVLASSAARTNLTHSSFVLKVVDGMYAATSGRGSFAMDSLSASLAAAGSGSVLSCRTQDLSSASTWLTVTAQIKKTRMPTTGRAALCVLFI